MWAGFTIAAVTTSPAVRSAAGQVLEGANVPVDEAAEERKGGAGDLAKVRPGRPAAAVPQLL